MNINTQRKFTFVAVACMVILLSLGNINVAKSALLSMDSSFGADTLTFDTETNLQWLDVPLSTPYTYFEIQIELGSGGIFEGFRLATEEEVLQLWENAGINTALLGLFVTENFDPIVELMSSFAINAKANLLSNSSFWILCLLLAGNASIISVLGLGIGGR